MEISLINSKGVFIKAKQISIAIDPFTQNLNLDLDGKTPDVILSSKSFLELSDLPENVKYFSWPGEYSVQGVSIMSHFQDEEEQNEDNKSNVFVINLDGIKIAYIYNLKKELHSDLIEKIGNIDLLILEPTNQDKIFNNTMEEIDPSAILPIFNPEAEGAKEAFFQKQGFNIPETKEKININSRSDFASDKMDILLLK
ncbi:hypothetical protein GF376_02550 [Candidatus Peregrinibacteria bacterium]|nr:hypothetical protein [Candidatus Peregrinibacteria bacterium]